jgi:F0F1-type ATP synthase assembly protein I
MGANRPIRQIGQYSFIGIQLAATVLIFLYAGYRVDNYFNTAPWFLIAGSFIGMFLGFYHLIKQVQSMTQNEKKEKNGQNNHWL